MNERASSSLAAAATTLNLSFLCGRARKVSRECVRLARSLPPADISIRRRRAREEGTEGGRILPFRPAVSMVAALMVLRPRGPWLGPTRFDGNAIRIGAASSQLTSFNLEIN